MIWHSLTQNIQYLYRIVSLRPNSCIFEFCTPKSINIAYLIVLLGSDMLELPPAKGNLGCRPVQAARADRSKPQQRPTSASNSAKIWFRTPPPPTHSFLKRPFLTDFKSIHTHPARERCFGASDEEFKNPGKNAKTHRANNECPREIYYWTTTQHYCSSAQGPCAEQERKILF